MLVVLLSLQLSDIISDWTGHFLAIKQEPYFHWKIRGKAESLEVYHTVYLHRPHCCTDAGQSAFVQCCSSGLKLIWFSGSALELSLYLLGLILWTLHSSATVPLLLCAASNPPGSPYSLHSAALCHGSVSQPQLFTFCIQFPECSSMSVLFLLSGVYASVGNLHHRYITWLLWNPSESWPERP